MKTRPERHQKQFAFLVSGLFTLLVFTVWTLANFGGSVQTIAQTESDYVAPAKEDLTASAASPLEGLMTNLRESWSGVKSGLNEAKQGLESIEVKNYQEVRNEALGGTATGEVIYSNGQ